MTDLSSLHETRHSRGKVAWGHEDGFELAAEASKEPGDDRHARNRPGVPGR
jgi:hypothetical protein